MQKILKILSEKIMTSIVLLGTIFSVFWGGMTAPVTVFAESTGSFDKSPIEDDLADINILEYPKNPLGKHSVMNFMEYCYSERPFLAEVYGIYLYIYNPTEQEIDTSKGKNSVEMAIAYDIAGEPVDYANLFMTYLDKTDNNRFYKFKLDDSLTLLDRAKTYATAHDGVRRYDISGIQLTYTDNTNATDESVSMTYFWSGFAKGCGADYHAESTLVCETEKLETISLDVHSTNYRVSEEYAPFTREQVSSVYFSVPERYFEEYGRLQKIKAEWYEYKTTPIFVTNDTEAEIAFSSYLGKDIGIRDESFPWRVLWHIVDRAYFLRYDELDWWELALVVPGAIESLQAITSDNYAVLGNYNILCTTGSDDYGGFLHFGEDKYYYDESRYVSRMDWLIGDEDLHVTAEDLLGYMSEYTAKFSSQAKVHGYAENLFEESIDEDRIEMLADPSQKRGYMVQEIDADEEMNLLVYSADDRNKWEKWVGLPRNSKTEIGQSYTPVQEVTPEDFSLSSSAAICEQLMINEDDYNSTDDEIGFYDFCQNAFKNNERPILFRFANTDYYSSSAIFDKTGDGEMDAQNGYVAQETIFLDFDIIHLTFEKDGILTVIPAVSDPVDVIGDLENLDDDLPGKETEWWQILIAVFLGIVLLVILMPILPYIVKTVVWVIMLPFRLIEWIIDSIKKRKR